MKEAGYVYILTNPSFKEDWVKIGKSSRPVDIRSKELDNTAVPLPFEIYATLKTVKYSEAEKLIHHYIERFTNLRIRNNREFFNVAPEEALAIFKEVALLLDDAEIEEVFKQVVVGKVEKCSTDKSTTPRGHSITWLLPANSKFFDVDGCLKKYNEIFWTQNYKIQKGDTVYIYSSSPDSCIKYKLLVETHDVPYQTDQTLKNLLGHAAYVLEGMKRLINIPTYKIKVTHDGEVIEDEFMLGMVSNSNSVAGFKGLMGKKVLFDDGEFEVMLIKRPKNPIELNEIIKAAIRFFIMAPPFGAVNGCWVYRRGIRGL